MRRAGHAAFWLLPPLACLILYMPAIKTWFQADDFAWLGLSLETHDWTTFLKAVFEPRAQGTMRAWSERLFFMTFYQAFGLEALAFHIWMFLTQCANLALLASIVRRLSGSAVAGLSAALLWGAHSSLAPVLGWTSTYNQVLCAFFLLLAFHFLLLFIETGRRRYEIAQWVAFILGFGALELNAVYPALAAAYTGLCARKHFRRTLPLFLPSLAFAGLHSVVARNTADPVYRMYFDTGIFQTLYTYWVWATGAARMDTPWRPDQTWLHAGTAAVSLALLGFIAWQARRRQWLPLFGLLWFLAALAPVLPLREHVSDYYLYLPVLGLALTGGLGMAAAWRRGIVWGAAAVAVALIYLSLSLPQSRGVSQWMRRRGHRVEQLVRSVAHAHNLYPYKVILLDGVDEELFWAGVLDDPFRLFGAQVFLTPGTEQRIPARAGYGDPAEYVLPPEATERALDNESAVVYTVAGSRLRNITSVYGALFRHRGKNPTPHRVDAGNPLLSYLLGPEWREPDTDFRWMSRRATVRIGGPASAAQRLYLRGYCAPQLCAAGPVRLAISVEGVALPQATIPQGETSFQLDLPLPPQAFGKPAIELRLEADRTVTTPTDNRPVSLAFGVFEVR